MNFFKLFFRYFFQIIFSSKPFPVEVDGVKLFLPPHSFDILIPAETFLDRNYEPLFPFRTAPKNIVDLGAQTGDFSIWASKKYRPQKIISVEMDRIVFGLFLKNILINGCQPGIVPINKAVYDGSRKKINIKRIPIITAANVVTKEKTGYQAETISLEEIARKLDNRVIDYLKIDIEGSEKYLLTDKYRGFFQNRVRFVALECHGITGVWPAAAEKYFLDLGFKTRFQKITFVKHSLNELLHAQNPNI